MNCINSGLCIFDKRPIQTDIEDTKFQKYYPTHTIEQGGPIEFLIDGQSESYIDLQDIFLNLQYRIKKADGSNIRKADDKVAPINLPIASLFRDVSVIVGEKQIEGGNSLYPYTSYLKSLLQFQSQAKKTHLEVMGWYKDEAGDMESDTNDGHGKRKATIKDTKPTELFGPLFRDIFQQEKLLINNTSMRIKLLPSKPEFALMAFGATSDFKIVVKSAILYVRRRVIAPGVINGHAKGMQTQNAHYPVNHTDIISFTIPANTRTHIKEQLFPGQQPKFLILGMVENDAFNGNIKKNPFNFQHFKMNKLGIYKDGSSVGMDVFEPDFDNDLFATSYANTMLSLAMFNTDDSNGLTLNDFKNGFTLYAVDLTPDSSIKESHVHAYNSGNIRLDMSFASALSKPVTVIAMGIFDSSFEITRLRDVIPAYTH